MYKQDEIIMLWPGTAPYSEYSPDQPQPSLKAFPAEGARGAVIVLPGGAYAYKAPHEGDPVARMLNAQGIAAFVLDYRVAPCHCEAPLADVKRAVRVLRLAGYEKVAVLGFSAGGNLCCASAVLWDKGDPDSDDPAERLSSRPDAFIPCYAVVSMGRYTHTGSRENLLGAGKDDPRLISRFSAELNVTDETPPAFIWHTAEDGSVPPQNSLLLAKALADHGILFELHIYPRGHHGIGLSSELPPASGWGTDCCRFLLSYGFGA
ncbi:MAG: alpha/beta hydrolase [Clostridia bacterium]|nr:alpha/beta hydrolase [Clostridia bacterium]